jgi:hypothetical protein
MDVVVFSAKESSPIAEEKYEAKATEESNWFHHRACSERGELLLFRSIQRSC